MQMSFNEWESAELLVQYRYKHTQRPCRVSLYGMFETKGSKNGGILSLSSSPCKSTLTQSSLFLFKKKKNTLLKKTRPQLLWHERVCTPTAALPCASDARPEHLPGSLAWKSQQMGLIAGSGLGAGEAPLAASGWAAGVVLWLSCKCQTEMGGGWRGGRLAWLGLEVPQALSKNTFPLIALHCSEGLRWCPPSVLYFSASMEPRSSVNLNKEAHLDTTCKNKTKIVSSR